MSSRQDILISKFVEHLSKLEGVRAIALVGSRGARDQSKIDRYSDADFLILCDDNTRNYLIKNEWVDKIETPLLLFPQVMDDEIRILFSGLFSCELHILTVSQAERLSGPCKLGSYIDKGLLIQYDPHGLLSELAGRIQPEPPEERKPEITSSVFWYNVAYCANLIARGDLFRASQFSNWYLQLFLLDLLYDIEQPGSAKYVSRKLRPDQYNAMAVTVSPLNRERMIEGLKNCMDCYWKFQSENAPGIDPSLLEVYRQIEHEVLQLLDES
ncbi:MAG: aminoglycoside 6-adenylyltransferase [Candidatus Zixiibacteriota bacterium]|nr:MAG: aminoglycoside 6-adenylyltransferase [candidate division Zixibacteria bacterium]